MDVLANGVNDPIELGRDRGILRDLACEGEGSGVEHAPCRLIAPVVHRTGRSPYRVRLMALKVRDSRLLRSKSTAPRKLGSGFTAILSRDPRRLSRPPARAQAEEKRVSVHCHYLPTASGVRLL